MLLPVPTCSPPHPNKPSKEDLKALLTRSECWVTGCDAALPRTPAPIPPGAVTVGVQVKFKLWGFQGPALRLGGGGESAEAYLDQI